MDRVDKEITITLPREVWDTIADACILVADFNKHDKKIKQVLRHTYYEIQYWLK